MKPTCPFCHKKNLRLLTETQDRRIYRCLNCDLISAASEIVNDQRSPGAQTQLGSTSPGKRGKEWLEEYITESPHYLWRFEKRLTEIKKRKKTGRLLDIGCATGLLLELARDRGWQVFGVDISKQTINHCQKNFPASRLFCGVLEKAGFKSHFFDVITVFDTLEHIPDFVRFLAEVRRVLKTDGLLAITVPNQACLASKLLGKSWFDYQKPTHLYFFTPTTLEMVLEKTGFKIIFLKKELFLLCPVQSAVTKLKKYYSHSLIIPALLLAEKLTRLFKIKSIFLPLEHMYVIVKKKS